MFDNVQTYQRVKEANVLTNEAIQSLYRVPDGGILTNMYFDPALAWKCTIKRPWAQGSVGERDTLGTQQHAPLLSVHVPAPKLVINGVSPQGFSNGVSPPSHTNGISPPSYTNGVSPTNHTNGVSPPNHTNGISPTRHTNGIHAGETPDRSYYKASDVVQEIWSGLELPEEALESLSLPGDEHNAPPALPSSYKMGPLAQGTIALTALAAAQVHAVRNKSPVPRVRVPLQHAVVEYKSERVYRLDGKPAPSPWGAIGGLHKTADGYVRIHDSFSNHRDGVLELLELPLSASRTEVSKKAAHWASIDLESVGVLEKRLAIYALCSYQQWDLLPQSKAIGSFPISLKKIADGPVGLPSTLTPGNDKCLRGLRVVELSRVIAAPLAGRTLAVHGADVLWVTSPSLPDLPTMDRDFGRGKRTVHLDIKKPDDLARLYELIKTADVFIQGFCPGSISQHGLAAAQVTAINPGIVYANMSAFGPKGPWSGHRGFDSLVQTCSGMNVSEAEHYGEGEAARPTPCQALDHGGGYLLATGIIAALYRRAVEGGSWQVDVSLAGVMKYLRSLGQYPGKTGFDSRDYEKADDVEEFLEARDSGFGRLETVRHSAMIESCAPGWDVMPKPLGSDKAEWLR